LQQRNALFAIEHCRTSVLGGHVDGCDGCGHKRISYNSCRNRHCPKCQGLNKIRWVDKLSSHLLPVKYFHIVFTIPPELNRLTLVNQRCMYDILFRAGAESLLQLANDKKYLGARSGLVAVLHTWGQNLMEHPHLHTLVPAGGWDETAQYWKSSRKKFFIPVKVISSVFRGKFLAMLKQCYRNKQLKFEGEIKPLILKNNFYQLLNALYQKSWVVYARQPFKNAAHIINYLGRYTHRVAISNNRIVSIGKDTVSFRWKDYKDRGKNKIMTLSAQEFIRRFLLHILPKGFCKIRYYGIFASRSGPAIFHKCKEIMKYITPKPKLMNLSWQEILLLVHKIDITLCPACKKGKMTLISVFKGNYRGPPEITH
jgi:hypothetical protein